MYGLTTPEESKVYLPFTFLWRWFLFSTLLHSCSEACLGYCLRGILKIRFPRFIANFPRFFTYYLLIFYRFPPYQDIKRGGPSTLSTYLDTPLVVWLSYLNIFIFHYFQFYLEILLILQIEIKNQKNVCLCIDFSTNGRFDVNEQSSLPLSLIHI